MNKDIEFLKELQKELINQEHDCQAAPRFWTVGDYKMIPCIDGCHDEYHVSCPERDYYGNINVLLDSIKEDEWEELTEEQREEFKDIACEISAMDWIKKHYDKDADLIPVREEHIVHPNTMFLTKAEAKDHIKANYYHYSERVHTYAMTAWRAPSVERLLKILETYDWESLNTKIAKEDSHE